MIEIKEQQEPEKMTWYEAIENLSDGHWRLPSIDELQVMYDTGVLEEDTPYWSGSECAPRPNDAWGFDPSIGGQHYHYKNVQLYAWAVRDIKEITE